MDIFVEILKELSPLLGLELHVDRIGTCSLLVGETLRVQLEPDKKHNIALVAFLGQLGPGKFREDVLKEGLKANAQLLPGGALGYSGTVNMLTLSKLLPLESLKAPELLNALAVLIDYGWQWQSALNEGKTSPSFLATKSEAPTPFGMRP
jgi:hypothetical protein